MDSDGFLMPLNACRATRLFDFSTVAKQMSDDTIEVESCWTGEAGARKCLDQALHLVGLSDGPLGDQGVEIMVGEKQKIAKEHKVIASDCVDCLGVPMITSDCL